MFKVFCKTEDSSWYQSIWVNRLLHAGDTFVAQGIKFIVIGGDCIRR